MCVSYALSLLVGLLLMAILSSCNSATRVVTMSSDGSYSVRYIDSKTPAVIQVDELLKTPINSQPSLD